MTPQEKSEMHLKITDACLEGDLEALEKYCIEFPNEVLMARGRDGVSYIHRLAHSAGADPIGALGVLLRHRVPVDLRDMRGKTPLMHAADTGHDYIVNFLIEHGAKLDLQDIKGDTAMIAASDKLWMNVMATLVTAGANMEIRNKSGMSAQRICQEKGETDEMVKEFLNMVAIGELRKIVQAKSASNDIAAEPAEELQVGRRKVASL